MTDIETKPVTKKAKKSKGSAPFKLIGEGTDSALSFKESNSTTRDSFLRVMRSVLGYHEAINYGNVWPLAILTTNRQKTIDNMDDEGLDEKVSEAVADAMNAFEEAITAQLADKRTNGTVEFYDMPYLYPKGCEVAISHDGESLGGIVESIDLVQSFFGTYYMVKSLVISNVKGTVQEGRFITKVPYFKGLRDSTDMPIRPMTAELKATLAERGALFRQLSMGAHYVQYVGQLVRSSWWSPRRYRADGRVMIDISSFSQIDNDQMDDEQRESGFESNYDDSNNSQPSIDVADEHLWRTYPYVYGFSFRAKQWGRMALDGISEIKFRSDAFDKLVLPEEEKELVRVIVEDEADDFSDLIDGKGGGSIFLLHGPPGQGKTLTAEAIAELLERPLYSISVGELGVSPEELEGTLREILDVATIWNAVLLLDEADIFLEARDEKDIVRNAMVGVFLRLLEYHQGVLFLTTNRVKNIDPAFYSRISIGLQFGDADHEKRVKIWTNLLASAGLSGLNIDSLASHNVNGRQIKNIIKISIKLARHNKAPVDNAIMESVIERTTKFSVTSSTAH